MWEKLLVQEAKERAEIFKNLQSYLRKIVQVAKKLDPEAEVYLFGSTAEGRQLLSSDIDILIVTSQPPGKVLAELWKHSIKDPFEVHVATKKQLEIYKKRAKLIKINPSQTQQ